MDKFDKTHVEIVRLESCLRDLYKGTTGVFNRDSERCNEAFNNSHHIINYLREEMHEMKKTIEFLSRDSIPSSNVLKSVPAILKKLK